jgi:hypothetical protein
MLEPTTIDTLVVYYWLVGVQGMDSMGYFVQVPLLVVQGGCPSIVVLNFVRKTMHV